MIYDVSIIFLLFFSYSFAGWLIETLALLIIAHKYVNRGFLIGPLCPIYGIAALLMIYLLDGYLDNPFVLFILATLIATVVEYVIGATLEKLFKVRWWDYSNLPYNLNGRIVLHNSILFGALGSLLVYFINPFYNNLLEALPYLAVEITAVILLIIFTADLIATSNILFKIRDNTRVMLKDRTEEFSLLVRRKISKQMKASRRLLEAFPNLKPVPKETIIDYIKTRMKKNK